MRGNPQKKRRIEEAERENSFGTGLDMKRKSLAVETHGHRSGWQGQKEDGGITARP
jgi:hypothetical protein